MKNPSSQPHKPAAPAAVGVFLNWMSFPFAVVPKAELCTGTDSARTADNHAKELAKKLFAGYMRNFRADVTTGSRSTLKTPSFFSSREK